MKKIINKVMCGLLVSAMLMGMLVGCKDSAEEKTPDTKKVEKESSSGELTGAWCSIDKNVKQEIEFAGTDEVTIKEDDLQRTGTYQMSDEAVVLHFDGEEADTQLYMKRVGDFMALSRDEEMEYSVHTEYFVRKEEVGKYESVSDFAGRSTVWNPTSGIGEVTMRGESYQAEDLYVDFRKGNVVEISKPEEIGDANSMVLGYAPFVFMDGCSKIEFIFNDPFTGETGTSYEVEVSDGELSLKKDGSEMKFGAVTIQ